MPLELPDLETLDDVQVEAAHLYLAQRLAEFAPTVSRKRGVIHDVLLHLESAFNAAGDEAAERIRRSGSLLAIADDPTLADDAIVDEVLSNYRLTRKPGSTAEGSVVVVVARLLPTNVAAGALFDAGGRTFTTLVPFAGRTTQAQVVTDTDRLIRPLGDGTYAFTIDVVDTAEGSAGTIRRNTRLTPQTAIPNFVAAFAEADFTGGLDPETNAQLLARLQEGVAAKDLSNRTTIAALVRQQDEFADVLDLSVVGYGDPEQVRYHGLFPVAGSSRIDLYLRSEPLPTTTRLEKKATLIDQTAEGGVWQVGLTRDEAAGMYDVDRALRQDADPTAESGYAVVSDSRSVDDSGDGFVPDMEAAVEAAYSRYQAVIVSFLDTQTDGSLPVGSQATYALYLRAVPLVAELQEFLSDREVRPGGGDILVKAAVPCDLTLALTVYKRSAEDDPDLDAIRTALADVVNRSGFVGRLAASTLTATVSDLLGDGQTVSAIEMFGVIRRPDGTRKFLRSTELLVVPDEPERMVTARTVAFVCDPADIVVTVASVAGVGD